MLQAEASSRSGRIDLAETLQLSTVAIALHALKRIHKSIQISPSQLAVLLPFHGAGVGSQRWVTVSDRTKLRLIPEEKYSEIL